MHFSDGSPRDTYDYGSDPSYQRRINDPKGKGRWQHVEQKPFPHIPDLPENPTEQQRAEHEAALAEWVQVRFHNVAWEWVADSDPDLQPEPKAKALATTDRDRPPMLSLPRRTSKPAKVNIHRHEAHCSVCRHPHRQTIEDEFVNWASPRATAKDFDIDFRAIYRHARVYNLIAARNRNVRGVLSQILERAEHIATPTADAIIRGVRAFTRVNDDGQWIEPPSHVIFSSSGSGADDDAEAHDPRPSRHADYPDDILDIPPAARETYQNRRSGQDRSPERAVSSARQGSQSAVEGSLFSAKAAKVRHAASLATAQLHENTHRRPRYPETHFAHPKSRKIETKANESGARLSQKGVAARC